MTARLVLIAILVFSVRGGQWCKGARSVPRMRHYKNAPLMVMRMANGSSAVHTYARRYDSNSRRCIPSKILPRLLTSLSDHRETFAEIADFFTKNRSVV
jgi:hypothetical protein